MWVIANLFNILYLGEMETDKVPVTNWLYMLEMFEKLIEQKQGGRSLQKTLRCTGQGVPVWVYYWWR